MTDRQFGYLTLAVVAFIGWMFYLSIHDEPSIRDGIAMQQGRHAFEKTK